ncbi:MAG: hypothetical protein PSV16_06955 [Flavobacterium sp.]|nr:hypothetical protein [Flavobacterium sp.]
MSQKLLLFLTCCITLSASAQEMMAFKDGKQYPATKNWQFICENYALGGLLNVQVAKTEKGGLLQLSVPVSNESFYIGGTVYLFLDDNSIITCTDKGFRENQAGIATTWYSFSAVEMSRLKTKAIVNVRFAIKGKENRFTSQTGHFITWNKKSYYQLGLKPEKNNFETETAINSLYQ